MNVFANMDFGTATLILQLQLDGYNMFSERGKTRHSRPLCVHLYSYNILFPRAITNLS